MKNDVDLSVAASGEQADASSTSINDFQFRVEHGWLCLRNDRNFLLWSAKVADAERVDRNLWPDIIERIQRTTESSIGELSSERNRPNSSVGAKEGRQT